MKETYIVGIEQHSLETQKPVDNLKIVILVVLSIGALFAGMFALSISATNNAFDTFDFLPSDSTFVIMVTTYLAFIIAVTIMSRRGFLISSLFIIGILSVWTYTSSQDRTQETFNYLIIMSPIISAILGISLISPAKNILKNFSLLPNYKDMLIGLALFAGATLFSIVVGYLYNLLLPAEFLEENRQNAFNIFEMLDFSIVDIIVTSVIIAPISEEIFFRGYIQGQLFRGVDNVKVKIVAVALIFTVIHLDILAAPIIFAYGLALGYIYHRTNSLILPVILHVLQNSIATVAYQLAPEFSM